MISKQVEKELTQKLAGQIGLEPGSVTPGLKIQAFKAGKKAIDIEMGEVYDIYDLASLTKVLFTSTAFMSHYEKNGKILENKILSYLPWFFHPSLSVRQLLTHTTGLISHKPFYIQIDTTQPRELRWDKLRNLLSQEKPEYTIKAQYSDLNYMLLAFLLQQELEAPLEKIWDLIVDEMNLKKTYFHIDNKPKFDISKYAPTEFCPWRNMRLQGQVHDENAWALGGVCAHAGLFGTIEDVAQWFLYLRSIFKGHVKKAFISHETLKTFWQRAISKENGDWALGFMLPSEKNSTAGNKFSKSSIGHTGFTGTSFWYDPAADIAVILLSNRVYFGRENRDAFNQIRVLIHDVCYEKLK
jgi:CubicO group peptidase (beta-lactamase class C family)